MKAAMVVGVACAPRMARAGPPGSRCVSPKTMTETSSRTTTAWAQRRIRNRITAVPCLACPAVPCLACPAGG